MLAELQQKILTYSGRLYDAEDSENVISQVFNLDNASALKVKKGVLISLIKIHGGKDSRLSSQFNRLSVIDIDTTKLLLKPFFRKIKRTNDSIPLDKCLRIFKQVLDMAKSIDEKDGRTEFLKVFLELILEGMTRYGNNVLSLEINAIHTMRRLME